MRPRAEVPMDRQSTKSRTRRLKHKRAYIDSLIERLMDLERKSDPDGKSRTSIGKDLRAFEALETAGQLVEVLAGWAIDHTTGLALEGLSFVPLQPSGTKDHPDYKKRRALVDDHHHEEEGHVYKRVDGFDPIAARNAIINLIKGNAGAWPWELKDYALKAFEGIDYGEESPLFKPRKSGRKAGLRELQSQLRAVCCVEYLRAQGMKKMSAIDMVVEAYGVARETVISWEKRLRDEFGDYEVSRQISFAKNHAVNASEARRQVVRGGMSKIPSGEILYGDAALRKYGQDHQTITRASKSTTHVRKGRPTPHS